MVAVKSIHCDLSDEEPCSNKGFDLLARQISLLSVRRTAKFWLMISTYCL